MAQIRIQGPAIGSDLGTVSVTTGNDTASVSIPAFAAAPVMRLPLIAGPQAEGDIAALDTSRLSNVTSIQWRVRGGADLGVATTQDLTGLGGDFVEAVTVSDEGTLTSPPVLVHTLMMMNGMPMVGHNRDDAAVVALASHDKMNRVATQNGNWSDPATWTAGAIPRNDDSVLIPNGVVVTYDVDAPETLIRRLRVDGTFRLATDRNTHLYVRDVIGDRMSRIAFGNSLTDRINHNNQATITIEGQSSLDLTEDPRLFGRGIVTLGRFDTFGAEKLNHSLAAFGQAAGDTSIVLEKFPTGWGIGDQIIIGGTAIKRNTTVGEGIPDVAEDEIVTITAISGQTVNFTPALVNDHNNQNTRAPENTTVRPMVQLRAQSRNLIVQSQTLAPSSQRGHIMVMHMHSRQDVWDIGLIGLGRTEKDKRIGAIDTDGTFKTYELNGTSGDWEIVNVALTQDANLRGRYSYHSHMVGYGHAEAGRPVPQLVNVTVEGTPGWAVAHHDCEMDIRSSSAFRFYGCGFIGEQGGELGVWDDLSAMQATALNRTQSTLDNAPKGHQSAWFGLGGDYFNDGYGFGYRGRSLKTTRCIATSCSWGHVFWHRFLSDGSDQSLFDVTDPPRSRIDLQELGLFNNSNAQEPENWPVSSFPIIHFADCGATACLSGTFVSKGDPRQQHDYNVIWKGFKAWGSLDRGVMIEYVATYILVDIEVVDGPYGGNGIDLGNNNYQIALVRPRTEGCQFNGIRVSGSTLYPDNSANPDDWDAATNPRFFVIGHDSVNDGQDVRYTNQGAKPFEQIAYINDDFDATYIDYDLNPTETWPDVIGTWNGTLADSSITSGPDNTNLKGGNHPVGLPIAPKTYGDSLFPQGASPIRVRSFINEYGYYQFGGSDVLVQRDIISDVLTGRPAKFTAFWQADNPIDFGTDNGPVVMGAAVSANDILLTVAPGGSVTFDALAGVTGGTGTFEIDPADFTAPDYGKFDINYSTGQVTFTARPGVEGQSDFGYLFIRSVRETGATATETRTYGTRQIRVLITFDATLAAPVHGSDFTFQPSSGATTFAVNLLQPPQSGGRRILVTQYSTDGGTTWRRLCNGWPRTTVPVSVKSDGTTLEAGLQNVRLRYLTDHEYGYSPTTADIPAVVGQPVTLIFGQSNAGFLANNDSMQNQIAGLGGDTIELVSAVGGAGATGIDAPWNIVDGNTQAGAAYADLLVDVNTYLTANPHAFIATGAWIHGETDAPLATTRGNYEQNVTAIFDGIRAQVGEDFPITVTGISDLQGSWTDFATDQMTGFMLDLAANVTNVSFMDTEAIITANGFVKEDVLTDNFHWNGMFLDLMAEGIMAEPAIRARYGIV